VFCVSFIVVVKNSSVSRYEIVKLLPRARKWKNKKLANEKAGRKRRMPTTKGKKEACQKI
jgi:hypothetical protein